MKGLSARAAEKLLGYDWPGNVRELSNCIERAVALTRYDEVGIDDLPEKVVAHRPTRVVLAAEDPSEFITLEELERRYTLKVLEALKGNKTQAARILGIERKTLFNHRGFWHARGAQVWHDEEHVIDLAETHLAGAHNASNVAAAFTMVEAFGLDPRSVLRAVREFKPLPHRLSHVGERDGTVYVDDSIATTPEATLAALRSLAASGPPVAPGAGVLVDTVFREGLRRWFGVLLWFVLLGPAGALAYRIVQVLTRDATFAEALPPGQVAALEKFAQVLDWPAAHLMTLALAVAADFDAVASAWRDFHAARDRTRMLDIGFLFAAGRASVDADIDDGDGYTDDTRAQLAEMQEAMSLTWRILLVWGVVFALFVLAGKIA